MDKNFKRERFRVVSISGGKAVVAYRSDNFHITVPASNLKFLHNGKVFMPQPGEDFEAVVVGTGESLRDIFLFGREGLEDMPQQYERASYNGAPSEEKGWEPYSNPAPMAGKERK
jgi:hypothetical protein